jgi:hypothetical protein
MTAVKSRLEVTRNLTVPFRLSGDLARRLHVKPDHRLQIRYDAAHNELHIGPYIGILVNGLPTEANMIPLVCRQN